MNTAVTQSASEYNLTPLKDLIIFEERLRQNLINLQRLRRGIRWKIIILCTISVLLLGVHIRLVDWETIFGKPTALKLLSLALLYTSILVTIRYLVVAMVSHRSSMVKRYEEQCKRMLKQYHLQLSGHGRGRELSFTRRLPKRLAELLHTYRAEYRARRALKSKVINAKKNK